MVGIRAYLNCPVLYLKVLIFFHIHEENVYVMVWLFLGNICKSFA